MPIVHEDPERDEATALRFVEDLQKAEASPELIEAAKETADAIRDRTHGGPGAPSRAGQGDAVSVG